MRTFCCCLPVRLGVFVLSAVTAVASALLAYTQLFLLVGHQAQFNTFELAIRGALAGVTLLMVLASIFGFFGSLFARRGMVAFYSNVLWIGLLVFTVLGGIELWQLFSKRSEAAQRCENDVNSRTTKLQGVFGISFEGPQEDACKKLATASAVVVAILFGILVLVLMWLIGIVSKYKHQLEERDAADEDYTRKTGYSPSSRVFGNIGKRSTSYQPAGMREVDEAGLLHTTAAPAGFKNASYERAGYQQV